MATRIFDRDTMLDLTVNIIPLFIIAFFVVGFLLFTPDSWRAMGTLGFAIQMGLLVAPFAALAVLTYLSGKAIAGDEKTKPVFLPGQAGMPGAKPIESHEEGTAAEAGQLDAPNAEREDPDDRAVEGESKVDADADADADHEGDPDGTTTETSD